MNFEHHPTAPEFNEAGECIAAKDWLGNRFKVGDTVMYCIGAGRGQMMALGRVTKIFHEVQETGRWRAAQDGEPRSHSTMVDGKEVWWTWQKENRDLIKVQVLTERTSGHWDNGKRSKPAMVNPMNITALDPKLALCSR